MCPVRTTAKKSQEKHSTTPLLHLLLCNAGEVDGAYEGASLFVVSLVKRREMTRRLCLTCVLLHVSGSESLDYCC